MKRNEISKEFTEDIKSAISEGFFPSMNELTGSYSDVEGTQMVFAKGNERIILWLARDVTKYEDIVDGHHFSLDSITAKAARIEIKSGESLEWNYKWSTQWEQGLYKSVTYYEVSDGWGGDWYSTDINDVIEARKIRWERIANTSNGVKEFEVNGKLLGIVRKISGFKTVPADSIKVWKTNGKYHVRNVKSGNHIVLK